LPFLSDTLGDFKRFNIVMLLDGVLSFLINIESKKLSPGRLPGLRINYCGIKNPDTNFVCRLKSVFFST
jgi:hypothetical protein